MLPPHDYGKILTLESCRKTRIDDVVRQATREMKKHYIESIELDNGQKIDLVTSRNGFGGVRYWFVCPECRSRVGVLYSGPNGMKCRKCVGYRYRGSRYKGMK